MRIFGMIAQNVQLFYLQALAPLNRRMYTVYEQRFYFGFIQYLCAESAKSQRPASLNSKKIGAYTESNQYRPRIDTISLANTMSAVADYGTTPPGKNDSSRQSSASIA